MKKVLPLLIVLLIPPRSYSVPNDYRGIIAHELYPFQINEHFLLSVPFYFGLPTLLTYQYEIFNSRGEVTYTYAPRTVNVRAGFNYLVTHSGQPQQFSLGRNYMRMHYQFNSDTWKVYYGYFYGYNANSPININDGGNASALLSNEAVYTYNPSTNSGFFSTTSFSTTAFKSLYTLEHDLHFDLNNLTTSFVNYNKELTYDGVRVSFSDNRLFPKLPTLNGKKALHLRMNYAHNTITFAPFFQLYVDPVTYIISYDKEPGFVIADKIYFPRHKLAELNHMEVVMTITNFSYGGFTLNYYFQFNILNEYFGDNGLYGIKIIRG